MNKNVLILGGGGFIGSHIAQCFLKGNWNVTIIDGLLKNTGGRKENLSSILKAIEFIPQRIENVKNFTSYVKKSGTIIDCMGWTSHLSSIKNPLYDLELNLLSHLHLIEILKKCPNKNIVYLGSRGQYGNPSVRKITEATKMEPLDTQGVHKLAAESHYRIFSNILQINVASIRFGNCFGVNQMINSGEIGLVGMFIKKLLQGEKIVIYGKMRKRSIVYAKDVADVAFQLAKNLSEGFNAYNLVGSEIKLIDLARKILSITKSGSIEVEDMPDNIKAIDIGNADMGEEKLKKKLGKVPITELEEALKETINYFRSNL